MRYQHMHFHHFPGHDHHDGHCHHDEAAPAKPTKAEAIAYLEYLCKHNEEHEAELAEYRDLVDNTEAAGLIAQSILFQGKANAKLNDAIAALKRGD